MNDLDPFEVCQGKPCKMRHPVFQNLLRFLVQDSFSGELFYQHQGQYLVRISVDLSNGRARVLSFPEILYGNEAAFKPLNQPLSLALVKGHVALTLRCALYGPTEGINL